MHENSKIILAFYEAFNQQNATKMISYYADHVEFTDPVFPNLKGDTAKNMWRMLCKRSKNLRVSVSNVEANGYRGSADWVATYEFSKTGRKVVNRIHATFQFKDGKIVRHHDDFDFWRWSRQAMGLTGWALGWTPFLLKKVRKAAAESLENYYKKK